MKYRTIVADPPWHYDSRNGYRTSLAGRRARTPRTPLPYPTLSVEQIAALPVGLLADAMGAHLYLWTTNRYLRNAFDVVDAWGFNYSTTLVWRKAPKGITGTWIVSTEFVLFARRGQCPALKKQLGTCYDWRRRAHSAKPEAFIDLVEQVSPGPYVELFSRHHRLGWDVWGDQSANTAEMPAS